MVLPWIGLPPIVQSPTVERIDSTLTVTWHRKTLDLERNVATFTGGVEIQYGPTTVSADRLVLYLAPEERRGRADGNVLLTDPDGTIQASWLGFNWLLRTGDAEDVVVRALDVVVKARSMHIAPERWELIDAEGTPCAGTRPPVAVRSPRVVILPGKNATLRNAQVAVFGLKLPAIPRASFTLDRRVVGIKAPSIAQRRGEGLGIQWNSGVLVDDHTSLAGALSSYPHSLPSYSLEIARSSVAPDAATTLISPRSDLSERFRYGYFDNIAVEQPSHERAALNSPRSTLSLGSYWNQSTSARTKDTTFNKPLEIGYEKSLGFPGWDGFGQARLQQMDQHKGPSATRVELLASASPQALNLGRGISTHLRFDTTLFASQRGPYGWGRAQVGVLATPTPGLTVGLAYVDSIAAGTPDFDVDRLVSPRGWIWRVDYSLGPRSISYLQKWDGVGRKWFDREYAIKQTLGCFEGFVLYREVSSEFRFGLSLRIDRFVNAIQRRKVKRPAQPGG